MQDKYVGDIGDFGKYILLNELHRMCDKSSKLGVNWYFVTRAENNNKDGRHLDYLDRKRRDYGSYFACSRVVAPQFMENLGRVAMNDSMRKVAEVERESNGILPTKDMRFYSAPIPYAADTPDKRREERERWFDSSLTNLHNAEILFLDPDNGIEPSRIQNGLRDRTIQKTRAKALKYAYYDEIEAYYAAGKSLIVYNHRDRTPKAEYEEKIRYLGACRGVDCMASVIRFCRYSVRDYIFLPQTCHYNLFERLIQVLTTNPLNFLFQRYTI